MTKIERLKTKFLCVQIFGKSNGLRCLHFKECDLIELIVCLLGGTKQSAIIKCLISWNKSYF